MAEVVEVALFFAAVVGEYPLLLPCMDYALAMRPPTQAAYRLSRPDLPGRGADRCSVKALACLPEMLRSSPWCRWLQCPWRSIGRPR